MAVPTSISELSTTPGSNSPVGADAPSVLDDHLRTVYAFIRQLSDEKAAVADAVALTGNQTIAGTKTFSSPIVGSVTGTAANVTGTVAIANGGTGQTTAATAFAAIKQAASDTSTGVVELATDAEAQAGTDATRAVTPENLGATVIGMGQTDQDLTASRALNTTYTNSTGRTIEVSAGLSLPSGSGATLLVGAIPKSRAAAGGASIEATLSGLVRNGQTYRINNTAGTPAITSWTEMRT